MPRARSTESIEAEKLYRQGMKLVEIARQMGKPEGTVRRWKSDQKWDNRGKPKNKKKQSERSDSAYPSVRNRGGQPGNTNAVGHGAPLGSMNAVVTGQHMRIYDELLTDDEKALIEAITDTPIQRRDSLLQHLAIMKVRESRLIRDINDIRAGANTLIRRTMSHIKPTGKQDKDGREITKVIKIEKEDETKNEFLLKFEEALTSVQAEIRRTEDSIAKTEGVTVDDTEIKFIFTRATREDD